MNRSDLQFTLADLVCAMLLLSALIGTLATHADHAHYIWYYLPVLVACEIAGFVISYGIFRRQRAPRSAFTAAWTTAVGALIGVVLPLALLMSLPMLPLGVGIHNGLKDLVWKKQPPPQPLPPALEKVIADVKQQAKHLEKSRSDRSGPG